ncbi:von Willebrand factor type A domain-containing protein, partial [Mesorhizobium sp. BR1-1-5]|nr:von Willebrand factor type A domain-containing protein [Mesorhizobium sp. BR1-1-5]
MVDDNELRKLRNAAVPAPDESAKARAFEAALRAYDQENISAVTQGSVGGLRLTERAQKLWSEIMQKKLIATPALAGLVALPIAGYATFHLLREQPSPFGGDEKITETLADKPATQKPTVAEPKQAPTALEKDKKADLDVESRDASDALAPAAPPNSESDAAGGAAQPGAPVSPTVSSRFDLKTYSGKEVEYGTLPTSRPAPAPSGEVSRESAGLMPNAPNAARANRVQGAEPKLMAPQQPAAIPADQIAPQEENRDRVQDFKTNPVHAALQDPVSTFSIDVDTASYSFVRGSLKQGYLPQADAVRVEEMINYFPYDWKGPESASTPFNSTVSVMPTPWNAHTKLMHVAIKGFDIKPTEQPKANLVFLIDVSGSMDEPDKLPLLKSAFRLLVSK